MDDDFGTPEAVAVLQALSRDINSARNTGEIGRAARLGAELRSLASVLGIAQLKPEEWFRSASRSDLAASSVESLIDARNSARRAKNWPEADRIRAELVSAGVIPEDKLGGGTTWRRT
jgi:cysteinyl-tRNA synthetase